MDVLILQRHGKAVRDHEAPSDRARGLTERGRADAREAGERLAALRLAPEIALVSAAERTRQTWAAMAAALPEVEARVLEDLYMADPAAIWAAAASSGAARVLVVGHNPGLADLAAHLARDSDEHSRLAREIAGGLSTSAFAAFSLRGEDLDGPGAGILGGWRPERGAD